MSQPEEIPENQNLIRQDYDGAWKAALEKYFKEFLELLFPAIHAEVDWSKGHEFLDGELEKNYCRCQNRPPLYRQVS